MQTTLADLSRNLPPPVPEVLGPAWEVALDLALRHEPPARLVGAHRFNGTARDREAGARFAARRLGTAPDPGRVIVAHGTQAVLERLFEVLALPTRRLAVEALTYAALPHFARRLGIDLVPVAMDDEGLLPDALDTICREGRPPSALYTVPTFQNPTGGVMPLARRHAIADVARRHGLPVIEDDVYALLAEDAPPPLASLLPELGWYVLGVAKGIAPGLKVAYAVAPSPAAAERAFWPGTRLTGWMAAPVSAALAASLIETGGAAAAIGAIRAEMAARHDLARQILGVAPEPGGLHLWLRVAGSPQALDAWLRSRGVSVAPGKGFAMDGSAPPYARLGLGVLHDRASLRGALTTVAEALLPTAAMT